MPVFNLFWVNFLLEVRPSAINFAHRCPISPALSFPQFVFLMSLSKITWPYICGFTPGLSISFSSSLFMFLCKWKMFLFDCCNIVVQFEIKDDACSFIPLAQDYFGFLWFPTNIRVIFSIFVKNAAGNLIGVTLNLWVTLERMDILTTLIFPIHEHIFKLICVTFNFLINVSFVAYINTSM